MHPRNENLLQNARNLRKNMTKEERHLWFDFLRDYPIRFRRQEIIGNYIADFYCSAAALVVELDGSQHYEDKGKAADLQRTDYLKEIGLTVLRFSNLDVMRNFRGVCERIDLVVKEKTPQSARTSLPAPLSGEPAPSVTAVNGGDSSPFRGAIKE